MTTPNRVTEIVEDALESIINKLDDGYKNPTFGMVDFLREKLTTLVAEAKARGRQQALQNVKQSIPMRSDWDDDIKVTAQMVIDVMHENVDELLALTNHTV